MKPFNIVTHGCFNEVVQAAVRKALSSVVLPFVSCCVRLKPGLRFGQEKQRPMS